MRIFNLGTVSCIWVNTDSRQSTEVILPAALPQTHTAPPRLTNKQTIKNVQGLFIKWIDLPRLLLSKGGFRCFLWFYDSLMLSEL